MQAKERVCMALDLENPRKAKQLVSLLRDEVGCFKVGLQLFTSEGPRFVEKLVESGAKVFLDLKLHDIPNTVLNTAKNFVKMGVFMFNVHAWGGFEMMRATMEAVTEEAEKRSIERPIALAVTVLTSLDDRVLKSELNVSASALDQVVALAKLSKQAGLDGVVSSPKETRAVKAICGGDFLLVTPGIRPDWNLAKDDQKRVTTPRDAIEAGSDFIVIGRPILEAKDPVVAARKIVAEIQTWC